MFQAPKLTNAGKALYYDNMAGTQLKFTTIKLGNGTLSGPIANLTDLVNTVVTIDAKATKYEDYANVVGAFSNAQLAEGFYWREIGVFAANPSDPDNRAADILYCYQNAYDTADFIPVAAVETVEKNITVPVIVGDASAVSCTLSNSLVYVTQQDLENHNKDAAAHAALIQQVNNSLKEKQDIITATGMLKGTADLNGNPVVIAATPGTDYQPPTQELADSTAMTIEDTVPFFSSATGTNKKVTLKNLKAALDDILVRIAVTTPPTKTSYFSGNTFDPTGMVVTATYGDGSTGVVTDYTCSPTGALTSDITAITISYTYNGSTKTTTQAITMTAVSTTLNANSWATIRAISDAGAGASYWSVGDVKTITINGTVGNTTFSNLSVDLFILSFSHNTSREGTNRIHFQLGKISGTPVALVDSNYGNYGSSASYFQMNATNTNSGGWNGSSMRNSLLGNSGTPTSPPAGSLLAALPSDLRAVMKPVTKYSDNTGGGSDNAGYVTSTTDYLFLLSEFEYYGTRTYANSAEQNYQTQYVYYQAGNSKIKYKHNATGTTAIDWCRSVRSSNAATFCTAYGGSASNAGANYSYGVAPGLCA